MFLDKPDKKKDRTWSSSSIAAPTPSLLIFEGIFFGLELALLGAIARQYKGGCRHNVTNRTAATETLEYCYVTLKPTSLIMVSTIVII